MMFLAAMAGIVVTMLIALVRAVKGPTPFDRILAANTFGTKTILLIAVAGFLTGRPDWLDLAMVYALVNFASTIAVLKFVRFGDLAHGDEAEEQLMALVREQGAGVGAGERGEAG